MDRGRWPRSTCIIRSVTIIEGTVPGRYAEPALFQQSFGWLDENGKELRYQSLYHHAFPAPPRGVPPGQENPGN